MPPTVASQEKSAGGYPASPGERTRWILQQRGARNPPDPYRPHAFLIEPERFNTWPLIDSLVDQSFVRPEARDAVSWVATVPEALQLIEAGWASTELPPEPTPEEILEAEP